MSFGRAVPGAVQSRIADSPWAGSLTAGEAAALTAALAEGAAEGAAEAVAWLDDDAEGNTDGKAEAVGSAAVGAGSP
jgi:hypothetical protein